MLRKDISMKKMIIGITTSIILSLMIITIMLTSNDFNHVNGQSSELERKKTIYSVVEDTLKSQYELFMDEFQCSPQCDAMESESALSAANKISTIDPVEVTNDIFEREQLKGEVLDNKSITSEVALMVTDEVVTGGPNLRSLLP